MNDKTSLTGATTLRPIDIEKLAKSSGEYVKNKCGTYEFTFGELEQFAEAYAAKVLEDKERDIEGILDDTQSLANELLRSKSQITELQAKIEEKEREVAELKSQKVRHDQLVDYLKSGIAEELEQRILELQADNNDLREALDMLIITKEYKDKQGKDAVYETMRTNAWKVAENALSATPAESLQAFENSVIEKCAKVCDEQGAEWDSDSQITHLNYAEHCAMIIRALKEVK